MCSLSDCICTITFVASMIDLTVSIDEHALLQRDRLDAHAMFERVSEEELDKDPAAGLLYEVSQ